MSDGPHWGYKKGELEIGTQSEYEPDPAYPDYDDILGHHWGRSRVKRSWKVAKLPHQCDEWLIGTADQVRELIADLQDALTKLEP